MVEAFVDGFRDSMLWAAWIFGASCGLAIVVAVCSVLTIGGDIAKLLWKRRPTAPAAEGAE